jgi:hypothetical protein
MLVFSIIFSDLKIQSKGDQMPGLAVGLANGLPSIQIDSFSMVAPTIINDSIKFSYQVLVDGNQIVSPKFTFINGSPRFKVFFGDGSAPKPVTSNVEITHTYYVGGLYTIMLHGSLQEEYLEYIDISGDQVVAPESWPELLSLKTLITLNDIWVIGYGKIGILKIGR